MKMRAVKTPSIRCVDKLWIIYHCFAQNTFNYYIFQNKGGDEHSNPALPNLVNQREITDTHSTAHPGPNMWFGDKAVSDSHPAVNDHHVQRVGVQPVLYGLTDGADLIQRRSVEVRPSRVQSLRRPTHQHSSNKH